MMRLAEAIKKRRSVRRWTEQPVPRSVIERIAGMATYAPTPCNQQLWRLVEVRRAAMKRRLIREAYSSTLIRRAPVVLVVTYDGWSRKESMQAASMAVQNILLAAQDEEVGALAMNSYGADSVIRRLLGIPKRYDICCFVCLGYPKVVEEKAPSVPRRPVAEVLDSERFRAGDLIPFTYEPEDWSLDHLRRHQEYYCRKTFLGKEMDISHPYEKEVVKNALRGIGGIKGPVLDLFTYDGAYLELFGEREVIAVDLSPATMEYTAEARRLSAPRTRVRGILYDPQKGLPTAGAATMLFKAERLSRKVRLQALRQARKALKKGGRLVVVARRRGMLYMLFYHAIRLLFGDDIRRTGIYAFFGPYRPLSARELRSDLREAGFARVRQKKYFFVPPFLDQAYQMYLQFKKSEGSSYLHRERRENLLSRVLAAVLRWQGLRRSPWGEVMVIEADT